MAEFPTKILVATDGSEDSLVAIQKAADLANDTGAELHMVYVMLISYWFMPDNLSAAQYQRLKDDAQNLLDGQVRKAEEAGANITQAHLRTGRRTDEEVINLGEEIDADMIVVGSRGQGTLSRALMGSDSESIVRHADVPVLVVRDQQRV